MTFSRLLYPVLRRMSLLLLLLAWSAASARGADRIPLHVEAPSEGAPLTVGIPFPKGALQSPDHVRLLREDGSEVPAQVTEVTTWEPADPSVKWIWVFFFAEDADAYVLEYGPDVQRAPVEGDRIEVVNNMRSGQFSQVDTGPLRFRVPQGEGGFLDDVYLDLDGDGFDEGDLIADAPGARGSFLDLIDANGPDASHAVVHRTWVEKGSGPLHLIVRVEGEYRYDRDDNNAAPFTTRIHAYAGRSFVRVLHTFTYTGEPDQHPELEGEHELIATQPDRIVDEEDLADDEGWTEPDDRIAALGLALRYRLEGPLRFTTSYRGGTWWQPGDEQRFSEDVGDAGTMALRQTGPDPLPQDPNPSSSATEHLDGFRAEVVAGGDVQASGSRGVGWIDVTGRRRGVAVGRRAFFEEYPSEMRLDVADTTVTAFIWPDTAPPMSFARSNNELDGGMMDNFAQGLAKTVELVYAFHGAGESADAVARTMGYVIDPPVAHAEPSWYAASTVYGSMAPRTERYAAYERGLDYKYQWWLYNQDWEPWYGLFNYGDGKTYYFRDDWWLWTNNEPATDYMWWLAFMRTGERDYYLSAEATSRHTMDVDNTHWPKGPRYVGDSNASLDAWTVMDQPAGSPYLGMGRRHGSEQWTAMLSAHVWVPGWVASYYLSGYHRGLDVAKQTADYYVRRIFREHGLRGRRLYLSVWNLAEVYDATKDPRYGEELRERVDLMLALQKEQGGSLVIDRYGYAQVYASHGLGKVYRMTGDEAVARALVRHARRVRDVPPRNHGMESYLSTIHSLLKGYELSGSPSLLAEARRRAQVLQTDRLPSDDPFRQTRPQAELAEALEAVSHLPDSEGPRPPIWKITNGLRVFGWTHAYNVPYLVYWLDHEGLPATAAQ